LTKWWHVSWKRVAISLVVIFGGLWLLDGAILLVSIQLMPWHLAQDIRRDDPQTSQIPAMLPDPSLAPLNGTQIQVYGFLMKTPWQEIDRQETSRSISLWSFKEGATVSITNDSGRRTLASIAQGDPEEVRVFGQDTIRSEFALMTAEMNATPDDVKWWKLPQQNARAMMLVGFKGTRCNKYGRIYATGFGRMHGFQEGSPNVAPYKIALNLFDADDRHYEILIMGKEGKPLPLTQAQLNSMVASIQPDPHN
jgi:hypothetical protein